MKKSDKRRLIGELVTATAVITPGPTGRRARNIVIMLACNVALVMTGYGIIMPIFARRLGTFGSGVESLGLMIAGFALAQLILAPVAGSLADRYGRRPLVLIALAGYAILNFTFIFAAGTGLFICLRTLQGAVTAGLLPAAQSIVGDIIPENKRAQSLGIVMAGFAFGHVFGPVVGGLLYDAWGFVAPFAVSAGAAALAFILSGIMIPETRSSAARRIVREQARPHGEKASFLSTLPGPILIFSTLLCIQFVLVFSFVFTEPILVFYAYDKLSFTTSQFGLLVGVYGLTMVLGQSLLGNLSDIWGRKPIIMVGLIIMSVFFTELMYLTHFSHLFLAAASGGLGNALVVSSQAAFTMDIADERHRSQIMGIQASFGAAGGVAGPLLAGPLSKQIAAPTIFMIPAIVCTVAALLALSIFKDKRHILMDQENAYTYLVSERSQVAAASLRTLVISARMTRKSGSR